LHAAVFFSSFDRLLIAPLLLPIARDLDVPLSRVAAMATAYFVAYGLMQLVWGVVSDRLGRVATVRLALAIAGAAAAVTALAPTLEVLVVARVVAGGAFAAAVPGAIIYIGDTVPAARRHAPLTDLMTATALGMAGATLVGAALADLLSWRFGFAIPAVFALGLAALLRRMPEPASASTAGPASLTVVLGRIGGVLRQRWSVVVLTFSFTEGMVLLGILTYLPTTLQSGGVTTSVSGLVTAAYGLAVVGWAGLVKRLSRRVGPSGLIAVGGTAGATGHLSLVVDQGVVGVLVASVAFAAAWAFMHSTMQKWATEVAPRARATVVSLFASALFLGSGLWTAVGVPFVERGALVPYFAAGLAVAVLLTATATAARARYPG
jgi:predicted MFS family arabinose efflux permease